MSRLFGVVCLFHLRRFCSWRGLAFSASWLAEICCDSQDSGRNVWQRRRRSIERGDLDGHHRFVSKLFSGFHRARSCPFVQSRRGEHHHFRSRRIQNELEKGVDQIEASVGVCHFGWNSVGRCVQRVQDVSRVERVVHGERRKQPCLGFFSLDVILVCRSWEFRIGEVFCWNRHLDAEKVRSFKHLQAD